MSLLLCLDFGNTLLKYALYDKTTLIKRGMFKDSSAILHTLESLFQQDYIKKSILSSVVYHDSAIENWLASRTIFHKVGENTKLNFSIVRNIQTSQIGADRLALCCGAVKTNKVLPTYTLIIALGSCVTYNFLDLDNVFLGGAISPGVNMRYRSMHDFTALLPLLDSSSIQIAPPLVGYDTETNLHSGVVFGTAAEVDGMIQRYKEWYQQLTVYLTGGDMVHLLPYIKNKIFAAPDLLMDGLLWIADENCL